MHVCPADFAARVATSPHACPAVMGRECVSVWGLRLIFNSIQRHLLLVAARWATCASSSRSRRYSIPTAQLYSICMSAHSTVRKALRRSCTISRFLEKLHELRFASPTLLPRLLYSTVMYHIDIHRPRTIYIDYCVSRSRSVWVDQQTTMVLRLRQIRTSIFRSMRMSAFI